MGESLSQTVAQPHPLQSNPPPARFQSPAPLPPRRRRPRRPISVGLLQTEVRHHQKSWPFFPSHPSDAVLSVIFQKGYFPFLPSDILSTLSLASDDPQPHRLSFHLPPLSPSLSFAPNITRISPLIFNPNDGTSTCRSFPRRGCQLYALLGRRQNVGFCPASFSHRAVH